MIKTFVMIVAGLVMASVVALNGSLTDMHDRQATQATPVPVLIDLSGIVGAIPTPGLTPGVMASGRVERLIAAAMTWVGVRYLWSGCTRAGIDCSCFVQTAYAAIGVAIPRTTVDQIRVVTPISASQATSGDLVFFDNTCTQCGANPTHVGLVLRPGVMVDAGDPVKVEPIYGGHNARYGRVL